MNRNYNRLTQHWVEMNVITIDSLLIDEDLSVCCDLTERQNHARDLVRTADLTQWDALVILSGDGLLFEVCAGRLCPSLCVCWAFSSRKCVCVCVFQVVNGLMERQDWEKAIQTPLGILPGGSGNALAASVHHYTR